MSGKAEVLTGHVTNLRTDSDGKVLAKLDETNKEPTEKSFDYVVNCTGPNSCMSLPPTPFLPPYSCSSNPRIKQTCFFQLFPRRPLTDTCSVSKVGLKAPKDIAMSSSMSDWA